MSAFDGAGGGTRSARHRKERRLHSWWRHERMSVAGVLASVTSAHALASSLAASSLSVRSTNSLRWFNHNLQHYSWLAGKRRYISYC